MSSLHNRKRRSDVRDEDELDSASETEQNAVTQSTATVHDMAKNLVRLALACESQRKPLRRQEIGEKVLGNAGRQFRRVFEQAQMELRSIFGMEMIELPAKESVTLAQRRAAQKQDSQKTTTSSWILVSILPSEYHDPQILAPSEEANETEEAYTAIYTLVVALIALNGGQLADGKMDRYLRRMRMDDSTPIEGYEKTEKLLQRMLSHGYILKHKESIGANGEEEVSWSLGPRGKMEVGVAGIQGLVKAVYGDMPDDEQAELQRKLDRSLGAVANPMCGTQQPSQRSRRKANPVENDDMDEHSD